MTKTKTCIFLFLFIQSLLFGQERYLNFNTGINIANIKYNPLDIFDQNGVRLLSDVNFEMIYKKNISVSVGFSYMQRGIKTRFTLTDANGSSIGESDPTFTNYDYLGMPLKIGYRIRGKLSFTTRIGLIPSRLINADIKTPIYTFVDGMFEVDRYDRIENEAFTNKLDIVSLFELETSCKIRNKLQLNLLLSFQHGLMKVRTLEYYDDQPNRHIGIGVQLGCKYNINDI